MNLQIYPVTIETVESAVAREKLLSAYSQEHVLVAADQIEAPEISDYINGLETLCWLITDEQTVQSLRLKFDPDRYPELALLGDGVWDVSSWIQPLCPPGGYPNVTYLDSRRLADVSEILSNNLMEAAYRHDPQLEKKVEALLAFLIYVVSLDFGGF